MPLVQWTGALGVASKSNLLTTAFFNHDSDFPNKLAKISFLVWRNTRPRFYTTVTEPVYKKVFRKSLQLYDVGRHYLDKFH